MKKLLTFISALTFVVGIFAAAPNQLTSEERKAGWQLLFDGESLAGWKLNESPPSVRLEDGSIVVNGPRAHLFYDGPVANHDFKNFELQLEVMTYVKANSGVYFHTLFQKIGWPKRGYEIQVNNSHTDPKRTGSVWGIKENMESVAVDEQWFTLRIKVEGKRIQTFVGDRMVVDYTEEENVERPKQFAGRLIGSGTFALQAHDPASKTRYRSIKVRVLP